MITQKSKKVNISNENVIKFIFLLKLCFRVDKFGKKMYNEHVKKQKIFLGENWYVHTKS